MTYDSWSPGDVAIDQLSRRCTAEGLMAAVFYRAITIFLLARALVSPIALRPNFDRLNGGLVFRVCKWQKPSPRAASTDDLVTIGRILDGFDGVPALMLPPSSQAFGGRAADQTAPPSIERHIRLAIDRQRC